MCQSLGDVNSGKNLSRVTKNQDANGQCRLQKHKMPKILLVSAPTYLFQLLNYVAHRNENRKMTERKSRSIYTTNLLELYH